MLRPGESRDLRLMSSDVAVTQTAARRLGFGARIVSGYRYNPDQNNMGTYGV
jgi:hypothetical protein